MCANRAREICQTKLTINQKALSFITYILLSLLVTAPASAQTNPIPILPSPEPLPESEPLPPQDEVFPQPERQEPATPEAPRKIRVEEFEVLGSTVFSSSELAEVLAPFRDRALSFNELLQAKEAVTNLYIEQGYITSGAYIPSQSFEDGVVRIQVLEGAIASIEIEGLERLNENYVMKMLLVREEISQSAPKR